MNARAIRAISGGNCGPVRPRCGPGDLAKCDNAPSYTGKGVRATEGQRAEAPRVPAGIAMLAAAKFGDLPLGGFAGEMLPAARTEPAPAPPQPLVIPPPPWQGTEGDISLAPDAAPDPGPPLDALSALKPRSRSSRRRSTWSRPCGTSRSSRSRSPPPTWREDEDRLRAAEAQEKLEASRDPYPARALPPRRRRGGREDRLRASRGSTRPLDRRGQILGDPQATISRHRTPRSRSTEITTAARSARSRSLPEVAGASGRSAR